MCVTLAINIEVSRSDTPGAHRYLLYPKLINNYRYGGINSSTTYTKFLLTCPNPATGFPTVKEKTKRKGCGGWVKEQK